MSKLLLILLVFGLWTLNTTTNAQNDATLKGKISYFQNDKDGDKPDEGALILFLPSSQLKGDISLVEKYNSVLTKKKVYNIMLKVREQSKGDTSKARQIPILDKELENLKSELASSGYFEDQAIEQLGKQAKTVLENLESAAKQAGTITETDKTGNFSAKVPAGSICVCARSKTLKADNALDQNGQYHCKQLELAANQEAKFNKQFQPK